MVKTSDSMPSSEELLSELSEQKRLFVELFIEDPNITAIAATIGVNRATLHRWLNEERVQAAVLAAQAKADADRDAKIEMAQGNALELISRQLAHHLAQGVEACTIQDTQKLVQISEKLEAMKARSKRSARSALAKQRQNEAGGVDWDSDPEDDV